MVVGRYGQFHFSEVVVVSTGLTVLSVSSLDFSHLVKCNIGFFFVIQVLVSFDFVNKKAEN